MLALAEGRPELLEPVVAGLPLHAAPRLRLRRPRGDGRTLDDVLARRTRASIQRAQPTMAAAHAAADLIAPDMGWDETETASSQAAHFTEACQKELLTAGLDLP